MALPPIVHLESVSVAFQRPILRAVSLDVAPAETVVIVGESGSGKSTLLRLILGLQPPDRGVVQVMGRDVNDVDAASLRSLRAQIGMVFQGAALFDSLTTFENVAFGLREAGTLSEAEVRTRVRETLTLVDLDPDQVSQTLPAQLSGGMRKRVGIARAVAPRPALLLYDEPTAGLDPLTSDTVSHLMQRLQRDLHVTSVIVSHDVRAMMRIADRIALLRDGTFAFLGAPDAMRASTEPYTQSFLAAA
ncbi:MAG: ATP-binding cassette domain-containing protein [Gemmatimonadaceae bacterium]|nr:ATP-binding cassette domain-containing protein [Gemmatimonadaceae bacterium]